MAIDFFGRCKPLQPDKEVRYERFTYVVVDPSWKRDPSSSR